MDLYGILNNSDNATLVSRFQNKDNWVGDFGEAGTPGEASSGNQFGDYIIGIQIPFNSMRKAAADEKYSVRNFFMPTGGSRMAWAKGSDVSEPATTVFEPDDNSRDFTGIKGTIQKATFTQLGGEPIFSFTIIFTPIDLIQ